MTMRVRVSLGAPNIAVLISQPNEMAPDSNPNEDLKIKHILLPHCWCCGSRFVDSNPPGPALKEVHHIIPRKAGGVDGPTVSICVEHHDKAHKIAMRIGSKKPKPYFDLLIGETDDCKNKVLWLATRIANAFAATANDPNKKVSVLLSIDRQEQLMFDQLRKVYPNLKSRESLMKFALHQLWSKHFTL